MANGVNTKLSELVKSLNNDIQDQISNEYKDLRLNHKSPIQIVSKLNTMGYENNKILELEKQAHSLKRKCNLEPLCTPPKQYTPLVLNSTFKSPLNGLGNFNGKIINLKENGVKNFLPDYQNFDCTAHKITILNKSINNYTTLPNFNITSLSNLIHSINRNKPISALSNSPTINSYPKSYPHNYLILNNVTDSNKAKAVTSQINLFNLAKGTSITQLNINQDAQVAILQTDNGPALVNLSQLSLINNSKINSTSLNKNEDTSNITNHIDIKLQNFTSTTISKSLYNETYSKNICKSNPLNSIIKLSQFKNVLKTNTKNKLTPNPSELNNTTQFTTSKSLETSKKFVNDFKTNPYLQSHFISDVYCNSKRMHVHSQFLHDQKCVTEPNKLKFLTFKEACQGLVPYHVYNCDNIILDRNEKIFDCLNHGLSIKKSSLLSKYQHLFWEKCLKSSNTLEDILIDRLWLSSEKEILSQDKTNCEQIGPEYIINILTPEKITQILYPNFKPAFHENIFTTQNNFEKSKDFIFEGNTFNNYAKVSTSNGANVECALTDTAIKSILDHSILGLNNNDNQIQELVCPLSENYNISKNGTDDIELINALNLVAPQFNYDEMENWDKNDDCQIPSSPIYGSNTSNICDTYHDISSNIGDAESSHLDMNLSIDMALEEAVNSILF
ncbi:uncharacterized protein LOC135925651 isoform X3 [Gordionus sp. m RMFG-2023]|uniref:uncharacterized protein LOC135925651 isoform X3 n=1 Tax=Gordionus sp. m RMFG-2023 TaxID=3053472 RepID=UPI0031FD71F5